MKDKNKKDVKKIIKNYHKTKDKIPYLKDLEEHKIYGSIFNDLSKKEKEIVKNIINDYILKEIKNPKNKWQELFYRYYKKYKKKFIEFRNLNDDRKNVNKKEYKKVEKFFDDKIIYPIKQVLTEKLIWRRKMGINNTIETFDTYVCCFFPLYNKILLKRD